MQTYLLFYSVLERGSPALIKGKLLNALACKMSGIKEKHGVMIWN
jgi:hypothetical protein